MHMDIDMIRTMDVDVVGGLRNLAQASGERMYNGWKRRYMVDSQR